MRRTIGVHAPRPVDEVDHDQAVVDHHAGQQAGGVPTDRRDFETAGLALAMREAGVHRFRPILLTSLTTLFGLAPLMWNRSLDASFTVLMAVSLGFGAVHDPDHAGAGTDGVHDP